MRFTLFGRTIEIGRVKPAKDMGAEAAAPDAVQATSAFSMPQLSSDAGWVQYLAGRGAYVDAPRALQVAAVFRCVDVIAKTMASLPLHLFQETKDGKQKARASPLYELLYVLPNRHTTAYEFWHMYIVNLLLTRGAFAKIQRSGRGEIIALYNIPTARVAGPHVNRVNGERYIHVYDDDGRIDTLRDGDFVYTPSMRFTSSVDPTDPIAIAAEVLGLTVDVNELARTAFRDGTNPGGYVEHPGSLSDEAFERFKATFEQNYAGVANAGKWIFLEEGAKAVQFVRDMEKSQALESRKFAVVEICRLFGVPPHLVYDLERATFSNIEHQSIEFVQNCITPMSVRIEQTLYKDLLTARQRRYMFFKFNVNGLLRGDTASRTAYYNSASQNGWMSGDEIRALEDMDKIPDGLGEIYMVNGNMIQLDAVPGEKSAEAVDMQNPKEQQDPAPKEDENGQ